MFLLFKMKKRETECCSRTKALGKPDKQNNKQLAPQGAKPLCHSCLSENFLGFRSKNEAQRFLPKCHCKLLLKVCCSNIFLFSYLICCSMFYSLLNNIRHLTRFLLSPIAERCAFCSIADRRRTIALPDERRTKRGQCHPIAAKVQNNINTSNIFASFFGEIYVI